MRGGELREATVDVRALAAAGRAAAVAEVEEFRFEAVFAVEEEAAAVGPLFFTRGSVADPRQSLRGADPLNLRSAVARREGGEALDRRAELQRALEEVQGGGELGGRSRAVAAGALRAALKALKRSDARLPRLSEEGSASFEEWAEESVPIEARASVGGERAGAGGERASVAGERASVAAERASVAGERAGVAGERASVAGERASVGGERRSTSAQRRDTFAQRESLFARRRATSAGSETLCAEAVPAAAAEVTLGEAKALPVRWPALRDSDLTLSAATAPRPRRLLHTLAGELRELSPPFPRA